jgi:hypothetical protein
MSNNQKLPKIGSLLYIKILLAKVDLSHVLLHYIIFSQPQIVSLWFFIATALA